MQKKIVVAALIVENEKILIAQRAKGQSHELKWEFPGGKIEQGETPEESLAREIWEELGFHIKVGDFCAENTFSYKDFTITLQAYWASRSEKKAPQLTVHEQVRFVTPDELIHFDLTAADIPIMEKVIFTLKQNH